MTFVRAQRYLSAPDKGASVEQFAALCTRLGRIQAGIRKIAVSSNLGGHCRIAYLESILLAAGYRVGVWTRMGSDDLRSRIRLDAQPVSHKQVSEMCEQIMKEIDAMSTGESAVTFSGEQKLCALALMAFCAHGCDVVLLDVSEDCTLDPMWVCAPYTVVMPCGLGTRDTALAKKQATQISRAVRKGTREVISGFMGGEVYNLLSQACAASGSRLTVPAKSEAVITEQSLNKTVFTYRGKGPYRLHTSFELQLEAAMAAIEACYALRRDGVRLPGQAMMAGLQKAEVPVCFDVVTVRPGVIVSAASTQEDVRALFASLHQKANSFGGRIVLCVPHVPDKLLAAFDKEFGAQQDFAVQEVIFVGQNAPQPEGVALTACTTPKRAAKRILSLTESDTTTLVVGDTKFAFAIKEAVTDALIGLS